MIPDLTLFYMQIYGGFGYDYNAGYEAYLGLAAGIAQPGNPTYGLADFFSMYPQFAGASTPASAILTANLNQILTAPVPNAQIGNLVAGSGIQPATVIAGIATLAVDVTGATTLNAAGITNVSSTAGILPGMPIAGVGIPAGAVITDVGTNSLMMSVPATATGSGIDLIVTATQITLSLSAQLNGNQTLSFFTTPPVPLSTVQLFINLAATSLMSSRWRTMWLVAMGWYIAHFVTLWMQAASGGTAPAQIVTAGLQRGITVSKSADGLSMGLQPVSGLDSWGAWNMTSFGVQLATFARLVGAGPVYIRG